MTASHVDHVSPEEYMYLNPAVVCKLNAVVGNKLVDLAILVALALCMADEDDHLHECVNRAREGECAGTYARFAHDSL